MKAVRFLFFGLLIMTGCSLRISPPHLPVPVPIEAPPDPAPLVEEGDLSFSQMHWWGWNRAATLYEQALKIREDPTIRKKWFDCQLLMTIRETQLGNSGFDRLSILYQNEPFLSEGELKLVHLLDAVFRIRHTLGSSDEQKKWVHEIQAFSPPSPEQNETEAYISLFFLGEHAETDRYRKAEEEFISCFPGHPLSQFLSQNGIDPQSLQGILEKNPDFFELRLKKARLCAAEKRYGTALSEYEAIAAHLAFWTQAHLEQGRLYLHLDDEEKALSCYEKALASDKKNGVALFGKGVCLSMLGRLQGANAIFRMMIETQEYHHGEAHYYLARNLYMEGKKHEARLHANAATPLMPNSIELHLLSGTMYLEEKNLNSAATDFRQILNTAPKHGDALFYLAQIALAQNRKGEFISFSRRSSEGFLSEAADRKLKINEVAKTDLPEPLRKKRLEKYVSRHIQQLQSGINRTKTLLAQLATGRIYMQIETAQKRLKNEIEQYFSASTE